MEAREAWQGWPVERSYFLLVLKNNKSTKENANGREYNGSRFC